jgi:hypothetical protein
MTLVIDFCGELTEVDPDRPFCIGREADLSIDDNPFLHRQFLKLHRSSDLWWIANVGGIMSATVADVAGLVQAWLAPGAQLPLVFPETAVRFTAGPTFYEVLIQLDDASFAAIPNHVQATGETTIGAVSLTPSQRQLILALAEPMLRAGRAMSAIPSSSEAATRLGWTQTRFNRKLDNVCQKLAATGVRGLHGGPERLASNRRARLVEYAIAVRLVTGEDLHLLDVPQAD